MLPQRQGLPRVHSDVDVAKPNSDTFAAWRARGAETRNALWRGRILAGRGRADRTSPRPEVARRPNFGMYIQ